MFYDIEREKETKKVEEHVHRRLNSFEEPDKKYVPPALRRKTFFQEKSKLAEVPTLNQDKPSAVERSPKFQSRYEVRAILEEEDQAWCTVSSPLHQVYLSSLGKYTPKIPILSMDTISRHFMLQAKRNMACMYKENEVRKRQSDIISEHRKARKSYAFGVLCNYIKSALVLQLPKKGHYMDLGCNSGQDVVKWKGASPQGVIFADKVPLCLYACEQRWKFHDYLYPASFICVDFLQKPQPFEIHFHRVNQDREKGDPKYPALAKTLEVQRGKLDGISSHFAPIFACESKESLKQFCSFVSFYLREGGQLQLTLLDQRNLLQAVKDRKATQNILEEREEEEEAPNEIISLTSYFQLQLTEKEGHIKRALNEDEEGFVDEYLQPHQVILDSLREVGFRVMKTATYEDLYHEIRDAPQHASLTQRMKLGELDINAETLLGLSFYRYYQLIKV